MAFPWSRTPIELLEDASISAEALRVYALIRGHDRDGKCCPSHSTIAKSMKRSRQAVQQHVHKLAEAGWIKATRISKGEFFYYAYEFAETPQARLAYAATYIQPGKQARLAGRGASPVDKIGKPHLHDIDVSIETSGKPDLPPPGEAALAEEPAGTPVDWREMLKGLNPKLEAVS